MQSTPRTSAAQLLSWFMLSYKLKGTRLALTKKVIGWSLGCNLLWSAAILYVLGSAITFDVVPYDNKLTKLIIVGCLTSSALVNAVVFVRLWLTNPPKWVSPREVYRAYRVARPTEGKAETVYTIFIFWLVACFYWLVRALLWPWFLALVFAIMGAGYRGLSVTEGIVCAALFSIAFVRLAVVLNWMALQFFRFSDDESPPLKEMPRSM